jgi:hypothetical protein
VSAKKKTPKTSANKIILTDVLTKIIGPKGINTMIDFKLSEQNVKKVSLLAQHQNNISPHVHHQNNSDSLF